MSAMRIVGETSTLPNGPSKVSSMLKPELFSDGQDLPWRGASESPGTARLAAAIVLQAASAALAAMSWRLHARPSRSASSAQVLEFHADAGAGEGALYVDGKLIGTLPGIRRL